MRMRQETANEGKILRKLEMSPMPTRDGRRSPQGVRALRHHGCGLAAVKPVARGKKNSDGAGGLDLETTPVFLVVGSHRPCSGKICQRLRGWVAHSLYHRV